jgi:hypothetical protein
MLIDAANTRRFIGPEGDLLAIYDHCRSYTLYAAVGLDDKGRKVFASIPRSYWADEIEEIRS